MRGFRPFFLAASLFAIFTMAMWLGVYRFGLQLQLDGLSMFQWHAHEMIYGYSMAIVAGFLLTAAWNWTGEKTAAGASLAWVFAPWVIARLLMAPGTPYLVYAAAADLVFLLATGFAICRPIIKARQKRQIPVLLILSLLLLSNLAFYLGAAGLLESGVHLGIYGGLYIVLGLVLFMGRRVIPFFTQRGVGYEVELKNARWNDIATYIFYPLFLVCELAFPQSIAGALLAAALLVSNSIRVNGWHTLGIWQKPLLWGLFASFIMINLGFLLRALSPLTTLPDYIHVHAFAVGGIGIVTVSMMARVTLGHTGRNVHQAPPVMTLLLFCMVLTTAVRVFFPLVDPYNYQFWITVAGVLWMVSFTLFSIVFIPMLVGPRVDNKP
ncbi:MAG: NnrS family protein [Xanthomonadales bacterium]|nr:NnrS family protein [Xanthomonadales bacterium]MDH4000756.1 NnrS family protein [Xanthomonadales bacterium]